MHKKRVDIVHIELVKEGSVLYGDHENKTRKISIPEEAANFAASFFRNADREMIYVFALSASMEPVNICLVSVGGMNTCEVHIPEIFKSAILSNCPNIMCVHNHTSGEVNPSEEDKMVTGKIKLAGKLLGIELQDHIIIGDSGKFFSFKKEGILDEMERILED